MEDESSVNISEELVPADIETEIKLDNEYERTGSELIFLGTPQNLFVEVNKIDLDQRETELSRRERDTAAKEVKLNDRWDKLIEKEIDLNKRELDVIEKEANLSQREFELLEREARMAAAEAANNSSREHKENLSPPTTYCTPENLMCDSDRCSVIEEEEKDDFVPRLEATPRSYPRQSIGQWSVERVRNNMSVRSLVSTLEVKTGAGGGMPGSARKSRVFK